MKSYLICIVCLLTIGLAQAQENDNGVQTIFGSKKDHSNGGYGALMVGYSKIMDRDALLMGARGGWIIDHNFVLGLGGYGFSTDPKKDVYHQEEYQIAGGYGGLLLEPIIGAKKPVHLSFPILIGAGGVAYDKHWQEETHRGDAITYEDSDAFFVFEPGAEIEFNMLKFFRVGLSVSYRYTSNINLTYKESTTSPNPPTAIGSEDMLRGFTYGMVFKFGKF